MTVETLIAQFNWRPGIGDPSIVGWVTVVLYFAAAAGSWTVVRGARLPDVQEIRAWRAISILFVALGINKQLDLQSALTEAGRLMAQSMGWYQQRQTVQFIFIVLVGVVAVIVLLVLLRLMLRAPVATWVALMGTVMVIAYVLMRAASFHHFDRFIGQRVLGLRWNWILEVSGITTVLLASFWRKAGRLPAD